MNEKKLIPILIITPFFAPQSHAAMFRVHKLVKYLPNYGYRPIVLTTDINYLYNNDEELLNELPDCVEIIRTRHIEPSLRGLKMALGGRNRTFSALKGTENDIIHSIDSNDESSKGFFKSAISLTYSSCANFINNVPDAHWFWSLNSFNIAADLIKKYNIKIMYTTANPYSHLGLASKLKNSFGLKWLADFRDPCGYGYKNNSNNYLGFKLQSYLLSQTFINADKITGLSEAYSSIFSDLYNLSDMRYTFIPTGSDDEYLPSAKDIDNTYNDAIIFSGEVMPEQEDYIFRVVQCLNKNNNVKLIFIGRSEINKPIIDKLLKNISDWSVDLSYIDYIPQIALYNILQSAKACILAPGSNRYWWTNFAKMVDYIALGVPVIADVPEFSEARKELTRAGLGFFLERNSVEQDALRLQQWLDNIDRNNPGTEYRKRYLASSQVSAFAKQFDQLRDETLK